MELLLQSPEEVNRIEVYNEYLRKIPELLKQLETVERMYAKTELEKTMLPKEEDANRSVALYEEKLNRIRVQCEERAADIRQQLHLIFELKARVEQDSSALRALF